MEQQGARRIISKEMASLMAVEWKAFNIAGTQGDFRSTTDPTILPARVTRAMETAGGLPLSSNMPDAVTWTVACYAENGDRILVDGYDPAGKMGKGCAENAIWYRQKKNQGNSAKEADGAWRIFGHQNATYVIRATVAPCPTCAEGLIALATRAGAHIVVVPMFDYGYLTGYSQTSTGILAMWFRPGRDHFILCYDATKTIDQARSNIHKGALVPRRPLCQTCGLAAGLEYPMAKPTAKVYCTNCNGVKDFVVTGDNLD